MATLRGAESAAFTQVPEVRQTGTEGVDGEGAGCCWSERRRPEREGGGGGVGQRRS